MAKKKFEEKEYDPIEAQARRDAAIAASKTRAGETEPDLKVLDGKKDPVKNDNKAVEKTTSSTTKATATIKAKPKSRKYASESAAHDKELDAFLNRLRDLSSTSVSFGIVARAAINYVIREEEQIIEEIRKNPPAQQPATHDTEAYAKFEDYWNEVILNGLRQMRPMQKTK